MSVQKILLIDDDTDDQLFFAEIIGDIDPGIVCDIACHGREGLEKLDKGSLPRLIFLDLNMPYMNGFDFLARFNAEPAWAHIPVIIFTTSNQQRDIELARELGAKAFLTKPNNFQELYASIVQLIGHDWDSESEMKIF